MVYKYKKVAQKSKLKKINKISTIYIMHKPVQFQQLMQKVKI